MPNHGHWLVLPALQVKLENVVGSVKRHSSGEINKLVQRSGMLWQKESFDRIVRDRRELEWYRAYIEGNPRAACLSVDEYTYYRADWLDE